MDFEDENRTETSWGLGNWPNSWILSWNLLWCRESSTKLMRTGDWTTVQLYSRILWWLVASAPGSHRKHLSSGIAKSLDVSYCWLCCCLSAANEREWKTHPKWIQLAIPSCWGSDWGGARYLELQKQQGLLSQETQRILFVFNWLPIPFCKNWQLRVSEIFQKVWPEDLLQCLCSHIYCLHMLTPLFESYAEWKKV